MNRYFALLFLLIVVACKEKTAAAKKLITKDSSLTMLTYGLPNFKRSKAENLVAKEYGFRYYAVAGCIISKKMADSVAVENAKTNKILEQRFGAKWEAAYELKVDTIVALRKQVAALVGKEKYIAAKDAALAKEGNGLSYDIHFTNNKNVFNVDAYGWGIWNKESTLLIYYKLLVDLPNNSVKLVSEKIEKW